MSNEPIPVMETTEVHRTFRIDRSEVYAVRGVSLRIEEGETVSIMGASGAGKSTLLHIMGGLDQPDRGQAFLRGRDLYATNQNDRADLRATEFGFVFQGYHLLPELDVLENVILPALSHAGARRTPAKVRKSRALDLLDRVGLAERARHRPTELSGGEQQRVAIARALMNEPGIILADEPTGNLDSKTGAHVLDCLFSITGEQKRTMVLVTHNDAVAALCERRLRLHDGRFAS